jgi:U4/U6.U5 tri-snRNP-associated protein 3
MGPRPAPRGGSGAKAGSGKRKTAEGDSREEKVDTNKRKRVETDRGRDAHVDTEEGEVPSEAVAAPKDVQFDAELSAEEIQMMAMMGIPFGFESTQGRKVEDEACNTGAVKVNSKRTARQYMNRKGGHNKNLPSETNH